MPKKTTRKATGSASDAARLSKPKEPHHDPAIKALKAKFDAEHARGKAARKHHDFDKLTAVIKREHELIDTAVARFAKQRPSKTAGTVDDYFARLPEKTRSALEQMREVIRLAVPRDSTEVISYKMPAFKHDGILVWYAAFANHVSLFPGGSVLKTFGDELSEFKTSKGTIQFPLGQPLPVVLIKRIVKARVAEIAQKKRR